MSPGYSVAVLVAVVWAAVLIQVGDGKSTGKKVILTNARINLGHRRMCSAAETRTVQAEWQSMYSAQDGGLRRFILVEALFKRLMKQPAFKAHIQRLINDLNLIITQLHNQPALKAQLKHLAYKRNRYMGAHTSYYRALSNVMIEVLPELATSFSPHAWDACLSHIGNGLTSQPRNDGTKKEVISQKN